MLEIFKNYLLNFNIFPKNSRNNTKFYSENHVFVFQIPKNIDFYSEKTYFWIPNFLKSFGSQIFFFSFGPILEAPRMRQIWSNFHPWTSLKKH